MGFSFITSDGYPFMGQNNEITNSQAYISDKSIYPFDDCDYTNETTKVIENRYSQIRASNTLMTSKGDEKAFFHQCIPIILQ